MYGLSKWSPVSSPPNQFEFKGMKEGDGKTKKLR